MLSCVNGKTAEPLGLIVLPGAKGAGASVLDAAA
jgi:hypothetical protein